jgi:hypothetical protein
MMNDRKNAIKILLEAGATIEMPYKTRIDDWYSKVSISKVFTHDNSPIYFIYRGDNFSDINEAVESFLDIAFSPNNIGYVQQRLRLKGHEFEDYELKKPSEDTIRLFAEESKLIEEELKVIQQIN